MEEFEPHKNVNIAATPMDTTSNEDDSANETPEKGLLQNGYPSKSSLMTDSSVAMEDILAE